MIGVLERHRFADEWNPETDSPTSRRPTRPRRMDEKEVTTNEVCSYKGSALPFVPSLPVWRGSISRLAVAEGFRGGVRGAASRCSLPGASFSWWCSAAELVSYELQFAEASAKVSQDRVCFYRGFSNPNSPT